MATSKPKPNIPSFPAPTPHKLGAGDVFTKLGSTVVIVSLPKGEASAECMDITTGKTKNIKRNPLETSWSKLGSVEAGKAVKGLVKVLKGSAPASAPPTTESKPRKKKVPTNVPAPGPNPSLN